MKDARFGHQHQHKPIQSRRLRCSIAPRPCYQTYQKKAGRCDRSVAASWFRFTPILALHDVSLCFTSSSNPILLPIPCPRCTQRIRRPPTPAPLHSYPCRCSGPGQRPIKLRRHALCRLLTLCQFPCARQIAQDIAVDAPPSRRIQQRCSSDRVHHLLKRSSFFRSCRATSSPAPR